MFKILLASLATFVAASVEDCSSSSALFKIESLDFTPDKPLAGENTTLTVKFNNPGYTVSSGTASTTLSWNFIPFEPTVEPLCQNTDCPIAAGSTQQSSSSAWPDVSGFVQINITWYNENGAELLCILIKETTMEGDYLEGLDV